MDGQLSDLGVTKDAEALWHSLMADPQGSLDELARQAGINPDTTADAVANLIALRLARPSNEPSGVAANDPELAIEANVAGIERQLAEQLGALADLRAQIPVMSDEYSRGRRAAGDPPGFEVVLGAANIQRQIDLAHGRHMTEGRSLDPTPSAEALRAARRQDLEGLQRGVYQRDIVGRASLSDPGVYAELAFLQSEGQLTRTLPELPARMLIIDRELAIVPIDSDDRSIGAMFIRVRSVIDVFVYLFDHLWSEATPAFAAPIGKDAPDGRPARILDLLAIGNTDESIARTLGVGVRTIRREVADLKDLLGVRSRAEIAAAAIRRGWL